MENSTRGRFIETAMVLSDWLKKEDTGERSDSDLGESELGTETLDDSEERSHSNVCHEDEDERPGTAHSLILPAAGLKDPVTGEYLLHMEPLSIIRNSEVGKRCLIANARADIELMRTVKHYEVERDYQVQNWSLNQRWYRQRLNRYAGKRKELDKERVRKKRELEQLLMEQRMRKAALEGKRVTFLAAPQEPKYGAPRADGVARQYRARSAPPRSDFITTTSRAHYAFREGEGRPESGGSAHSSGVRSTTATTIQTVPLDSVKKQGSGRKHSPFDIAWT